MHNLSVVADAVDFVVVIITVVFVTSRAVGGVLLTFFSFNIPVVT